MITQKYSNMTGYLEAMIASGAFEPGSKLPSQRQLMQQFDLSLGTVQRGIKAMNAKGLLDCRPGDGVYVSARNNCLPLAELKLGVVMSTNNLDTSFCAHAFLGIQRLAAESRVTLELHYLNIIQMTSQDLNRIAESNDAILLLNNYDCNLEIMPLGRPMVGLEMDNMYNGVVSVVSLDPLNAATLATDFFLDRNVSHVRIFNSNTPLHRRRGNIFAAIWQEHGTFEFMPPTPPTPPNLSCLDNAKHGFFFTGGSCYNNFAKAYRKRHGEFLCHDFPNVISLDGKRLWVPEFEPGPVIKTDWTAAGHAVFEEALRRIRHNGTQARRIYLDVKLEM